MHPDDLLHGIYTIKRIFDYLEVSKEKRVNFVAVKLKNYASLWWKNLKQMCAHEGRSRVKT